MITIPVITERCAGIDVGKRGLAAAVAVGPADKEAEIKPRWFGTTVPALEELRAWLLEEGCTTVAMESTGSYWIAVKNILEEDFRITLVCARQHQPRKGDKTDFRDAINPAVHHRHGLLMGSYLPERGVVELRDLTRRRKKLLGHIRSEKNRIQKVLDTANVKMGNVVSDVFGVSGQQILEALLGNRPVTAEDLADMAKRRLRLKLPQLAEALQDHHLNNHHRWLIDQSIEHCRMLDLQVEALEKKIQQNLEPYRRQYELLTTIPGIRETAAANILAEIGPYMKQFPDADHLCSWAGICSGNNRSAGKSKSSHIKKANKFLLAALGEAAWGAARQEGSIFQRKFRRWVNRLGKKKAVIAICRSLLRVIWSVLKNDRPYVEPDMTVLKTIERQKQVHHHARRLQPLGADNNTVKALLTNLLQISQPSVSSDPVNPTMEASPTGPPPQARRPEHRPLARGALGFRVRTAPRVKYSIGKDPAGTTLSTWPAKTPAKPKQQPQKSPRSITDR